MMGLGCIYQNVKIDQQRRFRSFRSSNLFFRIPVIGQLHCNNSAVGTTEVDGRGDTCYHVCAWVPQIWVPQIIGAVPGIQYGE